MMTKRIIKVHCATTSYGKNIANIMIYKEISYIVNDSLLHVTPVPFCLSTTASVMTFAM